MNNADDMREGFRTDRVSGGHTRQVRFAVRDSWERAQRRGLHPDRHLPQLALDDSEVSHRRSEGAMAAIWPVLLSTLGSVATEPGHLLFVGDADGALLQVVGDPAATRAAERAHLVVGAEWNEAAAGTNGVGTALALGKPFQVRGPEHYLSVATDFTCSAAPIRDPTTGAILGVVDVTCPRRDTRPLTMPLVNAAARLAQTQLAENAARRDAQLRTRYLERVMNRVGQQVGLLTTDGRTVHAEPVGWLPPVWPELPQEGPTVLPDGRHVIVERLSATGPFAVYTTEQDDSVAYVSVLGRGTAALSLDGVIHRLGRRHSEIVTLLLAHPDGLTAEALAQAIYGPTGKPGTIRAELARLRATLGYRLSANPYRLTGISADFTDLERELPTIPQADLPRRYPGPLLPSSRAPGVIALRDQLHKRISTRA